MTLQERYVEAHNANDIEAQLSLSFLMQEEEKERRKRLQQKHAEACKKGFIWKTYKIRPQETFDCPNCGAESRCEYNYNYCGFTRGCDCAIECSMDGWWQWREPKQNV